MAPLTLKENKQLQLGPRSDHYLIGIGASAGGLEAIHQLFDYFPNNSSFSFVIIQHLSPDHKSLMAELLSKHTRMQVQEAEDNMYTRPNCVYVLPSGNQLTLEHGRLRLTEKTRTREPNFAIDVFFESLAKDRGVYAIGIILSGTGTDGTKGIKAIKDAGGMVVVQDPMSAKFDGMPRSAIHTGFADYVLTPDLMPDEILEYTQKLPLIKALSERDIQGSDDAVLQEILDLVCRHTKTDFKSYKLGTIYRRIQKRMDSLTIKTMSEYQAHMHENPTEIKVLCQEFLIGVTKFFRDIEAFNLLEEEVIPSIIATKPEGEYVKVWITACSTGEEVYSVAMLFRECFQKLGREPLLKIFATDIDQRAITHASKGSYPASIAKDVSAERLKRFFYEQGNRYIINEKIRRLVIFAQHDLQKDPPFGRIDLISCRNMLIYLNPLLQQKVLSLFSFSLNIQGYLLLGPSEQLGEVSTYFSEVNHKWKLFKKTKERRGVQQNTVLREFSPAPTPQKYSSAGALQLLQYNEAFIDAVADGFKITGLYVDEAYQLLHGIGDINRFLKFPDGRLNFNLLKMVPQELAVVLSVGIRKALKQEEQVIARQVTLKLDGEECMIYVSIRLVGAEKKQPRQVLVMLQQLAPVELKPKHEASPETSITGQDYYQQLAAMEEELKEAREGLHLTVQDLSASNEELQSSNEELMTTNEELQSSNEEMQSLNEELHTVNTEHQLKIKELQELNEDLDNYIRSSNIGQIFVNQNLMIRKYTPIIREIINLIDSDTGRPVYHLSHNLKHTNLSQDIWEVNHTSQELEREVETTEGRCFLMRIIPYLKHDGSKDGVVISFVDITNLKRLNNVVHGVLNSSLNSIMAFQAVRNEKDKITDFSWNLMNRKIEELLQKSFAQLENTSVLAALPYLKQTGLFSKFAGVVETGKAIHLEQLLTTDKGKVWYEIAAVKMGDGLTVTMADITDKKHSAEKILMAYEEIKLAETNLLKLNNELEHRVAERTQAIAASEERFRLVSMATNDVVWDWNIVANELWWSESLSTVLGFEPSQVEPGANGFFNKIHPEDHQRIVKGLNHAINNGFDQWSDEYRIAKTDGTYAYVSNRAHILQNEYNLPYRVLGSFIDLSDLRATQERLQLVNEHLVRVNEDLDTFVYTASHDLKAPIANIEGLLLLLEDQIKWSGPLEGEPTEPLFVMLKASISRFQNVIKDLTDIAKVQRDVDSVAERLDLQEVVENVKINLQDLFTQKQVALVIDFEEASHVNFSKTNLYSIFYNLISNAIKYSSPARTPVIYLKTTVNDEFTCLSVSDNGSGISETNISKIFTLFKRFHAHIEGTGMGLYIVKRMIDNAGGSIEVESIEGERTTFRLYFRL